MTAGWGALEMLCDVCNRPTSVRLTFQRSPRRRRPSTRRRVLGGDRQDATPYARRGWCQGPRTGSATIAVQKIEGFWQIEEPEMAREFEDRDYAFFEELIGFQEFKVVRRVDEEDW